MSISQENLPATGQVKNKFRELEDSALAQRLQEQEFDQYYNSNVQMRRTAQQDFNLANKVAKKLQAEENEIHKEIRKREREDLNLAAMITSDELKREEELKKREEQDLETAALLQDEEIAWKIQQKEDARLAKMKQLKAEQERRDAELARIASLDEETEQLSLEEKRRAEEEASLKVIQMMQEEEKRKKREEEELSLREIERLKAVHDRRKQEEEMSKRAIQQMQNGSMKEGTDRPPPPSYDELQLKQDREIARKMQKEEVMKANEMKKRATQNRVHPDELPPYMDQDFGRSKQRTVASPTKGNGKKLGADVLDAYPRAVPVQGKRDHQQVIPGSDITYGVDPPPFVAEPKGKKKSKEKKQKK